MSGADLPLQTTAVFNHLRSDMAVRNRRGQPFLMAGMVYWGAMAVSGLVIPQPHAALVLLLGGLSIMPMTIGFSILLGVKLSAPPGPLDKIAGRMLCAEIMFFPLFLAIYFQMPQFLPQTMSLLLATPFVALGYIYDSRTYYLTAALRTVIASIFFVFDAHSFVGVPLLTAGTYALAAALVQRELRRQEEERTVE